MRLRKIMWALWLALCTILWMLTEYAGALFLLALSVLLPLAGILWAILCAGRLEASVSLDAVAEKDQPMRGKLMVRNLGVLPCPKVSCRMRCRNCFTGEEAQRVYALTVRGRSARDVPVDFAGQHCGRLELEILAACAQDLFGIVNRPIKKGAGQAALILPDIYPARTVFAARLQPDPEGQEYSMVKAGSDPSETFAIREYRPGDPVKNMHWKLSEKLDQSMVRELGLPISHSVLLVFDTLFEEGEEMPDAEQKDAMASVAASLAQHFCDEQIAHRILWFDKERCEIRSQDVRDSSDLASALSHMLSAQAASDESSVLAHYLQETGELTDAHVAVIAACPWQDLVSLQEEGRITLLLCSRGGGAPDGSFSPGEAAQVLRYVEV